MADQPPPSATEADDNADVSRPMFILNVIFTILPIISVAIRFWARSLSHRKLDWTGARYWWDDWTALGSMLASTGVSACIFIMLNKGMGRHTKAVNPSEHDTLVYLASLFVANLFFHLSMAFVRSSAVFFYQRIFDAGIRSFNLTCNIINVMLWIYWIGAELSVILSCTPVERFYKPWVDGYCTSQSVLFVANAVPNCLLDLAVLILPLPKLWNLNIKLTNKILLCGVFLVGYAEIVLTVGVAVTGKREEVGLVNDPMWSIVNPFYWIILNSPVAVICVCLPSFVALIKIVKDNGARSLVQIGPSSLDRHLERIETIQNRGRLVITRSVTTTIIEDHAEDQPRLMSDWPKVAPFMPSSFLRDAERNSGG